MADLRTDLERLDGRPYPAYKDLRGRRYDVDPFRLRLTHVQGDPFASPSRITVDVPAEVPALPDAARHTADARRATADFLHRRVLSALAASRDHSGSGKSGLIEICPVGQEVLDRTAMQVGKDGAARLRLSVGLPAAGRRILGRAAADTLCRRLPEALDGALRSERIDTRALLDHVAAVEDQVALRTQLDQEGLVALLAEGSLLPRRSGADDRPMREGLPLEVPDDLAHTLNAPHSGPVRGLAIPRGITLVVGGGYHGKSTLLSALARGVYDHVPGDGRERCVSVSNAVSVRAEDGRSVAAVDLRPFIRNLPLGRRTDRFDSRDASGSTSQAAAIIESLEAGAGAFLIDEDTAATNFMIRDSRMRRLVPREQEPITPFLDRVRELAGRGVSSVLVIGGAGDYLDVADRVIQMHEYQPRDVSAAAREVAHALPLTRAPDPACEWPPASPRIPDPNSFDPRRGRRAERVRSVRTRSIELGREEIDVSLLSQLVDPAQCRMIADVLLQLCRGIADGRRSVADILSEIDRRVDEDGLDAVTQESFGDRSRARRFEIAAALNRLRSLRVLDPGAKRDPGEGAT